jgi:hypothetical protein
VSSKPGEKFFALFNEARYSFKSQVESRVFDLSMVFLAIRNLATCYSLGVLLKPDFSRKSALRLGDYSLPIAPNVFAILERSRVLSTRAIGTPIAEDEAEMAFTQFPLIDEWMKRLLVEVESRAVRI